VARIVQTPDPYAAAPFVPGSAGMRILLEALSRVGVPRGPLEDLRAAVNEYEAMVAVHAGGRGDLELILGATQDRGVHADQLEPQRRMAFQGNSVIWGVQARAACTLRVVAPNADDPERADIATVRGLRGFRRLRPTASWPVLRLRTLSEGVEIRGGWEPVDPEVEAGSAPLLRAHCSDPLPGIRALAEGDRTTYELVEGPVGRTAALDVTLGGIDRAHVPVRGMDEDPVGEHYCRSETPVEALQFDLLLHRDLPFSTPPGLCVHGCRHGEELFPLSRQTRCHLPSDGQVQALGSSLAALATPLIPGYTDLVAQVCERLGAAPEEFRAFRTTLTYPPIPVTLVMHHRLGPARP
jgi:hypothetical protein